MPNARAAMRWKNRVLYLVVTATLTSSQLCKGQDVDSAAAVQEPSLQGGLLFRSVLVSDGKRGSAAPTRQGSLAFTFDKRGEQNSTRVLHNSMDAKLKRIDPSVQCSDHLMTLKVKQVRAPHFLVDSGEGPLTPLSQMPSKCGFSVRRSRRDVLFTAPYQGCHVTQQGSNYVLPLRLWGAPMIMSCPAVLPQPSVSCFPTGMVVKIGGITINGLKIKVSGLWKSLSSVCSSCGFAVEELSGGLTLMAPYDRGSCIEIKDEQYLLSLLLADVELLVTCPKPTTTTTPPSDSDQVLQYPHYPQYPQFPMFPQYPGFPGATPQAHTPAPTTVAPLTQYPRLPTAAATDSKTETQKAPPAQYPAFPLMPLYPQYPQFQMFPQYPGFPGATPQAHTPAPTTVAPLPQYPKFPQYPLNPKPVTPTQSTAEKNTAAPPAQLPQMPQSPQYQFPFLPQFPIVPGISHPTTPPPATSTETLVTTPAPTTKHDGKPFVPQQPQFPLPPQYPFPQFPKLPLAPEGQSQALQDPKPVIQWPKPYHVYPQTYQIPVMYPPYQYLGLSKKQNTQTAAPATSSTTSAATTLKPAVQKPFYYPHPYMPPYYVPQQVSMPVFPVPPTMPPANQAPYDQHERQPIYYAVPPYYPFPYHVPKLS